MRPALRMLAAVQRNSQFLQPGAPTGLTGLLTHPSPRSALLYLYNTTLDTLGKFPEHSVYRKSTEALIRHRLNIVESTKPAGLDEWQIRVAPLVDEHPEAFKRVKTKDGFNIVYSSTELSRAPRRSEADEANAPYKTRPNDEGPLDEDSAEVEVRAREIARDLVAEAERDIHVEPEPPLTAQQISEVEQQIGAGLIEEVVRVAESEKKLAAVLLESKAWEDLEEKPVEGQWTYFERQMA